MMMQLEDSAREAATEVLEAAMAQSYSDGQKAAAERLLPMIDALRQEVVSLLGRKGPQVPAETLIEELDLSVRNYNLLKRAGYHTIGQVAQLSTDTLLGIRNLAVSAIEDLDLRLASFGYYRPS